MDLYIKQRLFTIGDKYDICDENQTPIYHAFGEVFTLGNKLHLCNTMDEELVFIKQKVLSWTPVFELYVQDQLFATVKKEFTFFYKKISVESSYGHFVIDGSFFDHEYTISCDGKIFGTVSKEWLSWGDVYALHCNSEEHSSFFVALVLTIDCILAEENRSH